MRNINLQARRHVLEANRHGSLEKFVGNDGNINAYDKGDLLRAFAEMASSIASGELTTDVNKTRSAATLKEIAAENRALVTEAYDDPQGWAELGATIAAEIQTRIEREGFMRQVFARAEVVNGSVPRVRIRVPNVRAVIANGVGANWPQYVRDKYVLMQEFPITVNVRVQQLDIFQGSSDILEDKFYEGQEAIGVQEDRVVKNLFDAGVNVSNPKIVAAGGFTPGILQAMRHSITRWGLPVGHFIFSSNILNDFFVSPDFINFYDPISRYELIQTGLIGSFFGANFITDGFREPNLRVLEDNEIYATSTPEHTGVYTERGPIESFPRDGFDDGIPARGWYMQEFISAMLANTRAIVKAEITR